MSDTTATDTKPMHVKEHPIHASIFIHTHAGKDGKERAFYDVQFERRYKDETTDEWKSTRTIGERDLDALQTCIERARKAIAVAKAEAS